MVLTGIGSVMKAMIRMGQLQCKQISGKHSNRRAGSAAHRHWAGEAVVTGCGSETTSATVLGAGAEAIAGFAGVCLRIVVGLREQGYGLAKRGVGREATAVSMPVCARRGNEGEAACGVSTTGAIQQRGCPRLRCHPFDLCETHLWTGLNLSVAQGNHPIGSSSRLVENVMDRDGG